MSDQRACPLCGAATAAMCVHGDGMRHIVCGRCAWSGELRHTESAALESWESSFGDIGDMISEVMFVVRSGVASELGCPIAVSANVPYGLRNLATTFAISMKGGEPSNREQMTILLRSAMNAAAESVRIAMVCKQILERQVEH